MSKNNERKIVVVLASGRSGSSLLMRILGTLGMRLSDELIAGREENPDGFFEDARIVRLHADLLRSLNAWPFHPLPADWLNTPAAAITFTELQNLVRARLRQSTAVWGFKDPRTPSFLPLWLRLFATEGIQPLFVLALREPGSIIQSFMRAYDTPPETAEWVWLSRTCDALWHTAANCHIVHYEDWFSRADEVAANLARYTGLAGDADRDPARLLHAIVKPTLNRAKRSEHTLCNEHARKLYTALKSCHGDDHDRDELLRTVADCREALNEFRTDYPHPGQ